MRHLFPFAKNLLEKDRQSPSTTKIAEAAGIARGTAYKYLVEMAEKNMIEAGIDGDLAAFLINSLKIL